MLQRVPWRDHCALGTAQCRKHRSLAVTTRAETHSDATPMKIAIVGGGICGPVMATLMARELQGVLPRPLEVHLFDKRNKEDTVSLTLTSQDPLIFTIREYLPAMAHGVDFHKVCL